ncbi:MAG: DUF1501 domain-containing protein [Azospirillum sp.]|nr:DUF1501 domain-containing protein [Azospirillum sp.]
MARPQPVGADFAGVANALGRLMVPQDGARIAVAELGGGDTHAGQGVPSGRLAETLKRFAEGIAGLAEATAPVWSRTVVLAATEFGRTVAPNGTGGTDHGTASCAFLIGGAVSGGRVIADWPGLTTAKLHDNRDRMPTADLRAVARGILRDHIGLPGDTLDRVIFPDSSSVTATGRLIIA